MQTRSNRNSCGKMAPLPLVTRSIADAERQIIQRSFLALCRATAGLMALWSWSVAFRLRPGATR